MISMGWGTSKPSLMMRMAVWTSGTCPSGNWQSIAGPAICTTVPTTSALVAVDAIDSSLRRRGCAADDFNNFLGNCCLTHAVHIERQRFDHVFRVGGCLIHRGHAGRVFGGAGFEHGAEDRDFDITR